MISLILTKIRMRGVNICKKYTHLRGVMRRLVTTDIK